MGRKGHANPKIALVQEPHNHKGKVSNISKSLNVFTKNNQNNIRACIITTSNIDAWLLGQFCNEDQVAIAFKTNQTIMVVCSTYMPYDSVDPPPPKLMRDLTSFCEQKGWGLIIGADANSHNTAWGSSDTNLRGEELLNYIATTQLHVQNVGITPTFRNRIREEVIDITLATNNVTNKIYRWKVSEEETFSDHNRITFSILKQRGGTNL